MLKSAASFVFFTLPKRLPKNSLHLTNKTTIPGITLKQNRTMASSSNLDIGGIYPPIPTPFDEKENIAYDKLEKNLSIWNKAPLKGYVVQGSNGEYTFLTAEERVEMVKKVREMIPKDKLILAGSGCESTRDTIVMSEKMAEAGADAVLVVTPCYFKNAMTNAALINHYTKLADACPVPVILYSVPANTGIDMAPEVVIQLSSHPNIIGLKDSGGDIGKIGNMVFKTKANNFQILAGSAGFLYPGYAVGCVGGVCALANVLPNEVCEIDRLFKAGDHKAAQDLQHRLIAPNAAITKKFGVPGLKASMERFGFYGGPPRSPLLPATPEDTEKLLGDFRYSEFL
ncbi:unnamed protein product [Owenia fusiformis]|uniref:4-hydroxy-2-oxoglutarate aldolase, mitochondrial n=1 Tax=Owenia fusiformis TaxID=6347 RepID=A0A8S4NPM3_OWEFU|nr:unnamed protein product [Owenia fusiformis]